MNSPNQLYLIPPAPRSKQAKTAYQILAAMHPELLRRT